MSPSVVQIEHFPSTFSFSNLCSLTRLRATCHAVSPPPSHMARSRRGEATLSEMVGPPGETQRDEESKKYPNSPRDSKTCLSRTLARLVSLPLSLVVLLSLISSLSTSLASYPAHSSGTGDRPRSLSRDGSSVFLVDRTGIPGIAGERGIQRKVKV